MQARMCAGNYPLQYESDKVTRSTVMSELSIKDDTHGYDNVFIWPRPKAGSTCTLSSFAVTPTVM